MKFFCAALQLLVIIVSADNNEFICTDTLLNRKGMNEPNEDRVIYFQSQRLPLLIHGVLDGHGGSQVAEHLSLNLAPTIEKHFVEYTAEPWALSRPFRESEIEQIRRKLSKIIVRMDQEICQEGNEYVGSAASLVVQFHSHAFIINLGDSRTLVSKANSAPPSVKISPTPSHHHGQYILQYETTDHTPEDPWEAKHVREAGGSITYDGVLRVDDYIAMTRAFGDCALKFRGSGSEEHVYSPDGHVRSVPDIGTVKLTSDLIFASASDGVFSSHIGKPDLQWCNYKLAYRLHHMRNVANLNFAQFCNEVVRTAFKKSRDDITIIAVRSRLFKVDGEKQHEQQQKPRNTAKANPLPRLLNRLLRQRHQQ